MYPIWSNMYPLRIQFLRSTRNRRLSMPECKGAWTHRIVQAVPRWKRSCGQPAAKCATVRPKKKREGNKRKETNPLPIFSPISYTTPLKWMSQGIGQGPVSLKSSLKSEGGRKAIYVWDCLGMFGQLTTKCLGNSGKHRASMPKPYWFLRWTGNP